MSFSVLRRDGVMVILGPSSTAVPAVLHWGTDLGELSENDLTELRRAAIPAVPHSSVDVPRWLTLAPGSDDAWQGTPALALHRNGSVQYPRWGDVAVRADDFRCEVEASDSELGIAWSIELSLEIGGSLRVQQSVRNVSGGPLTVDGVVTLMPLPDSATELLDLTGRHCRERTPQRRRFDHGSTVRASRRGRTGHDATLVLTAGSEGFGFRTGEVWGAHVAWSGDHLHLAERLPERAGQASGVLGGGELLGPGEVVLQDGDTYTTPWVHFVYSDAGLDGSAQSLHRWMRSRPAHPTSPRPVVLNVWEGVYFDHDLTRLRGIADVAAHVGVERFVLDDGWFRHRRDDRAGLGDWQVDEGVWPDGLAPLFDHVRELGMSPGLWFEPEMVNLDSDITRAHPDWLLAAPGRLPLEWRHQHVLDLTRPEVFEYLLTAIDTVLTNERPDYVKWDHNRDLMLAVDSDGRPAVHAQTSAFYRLLDALRSRHPHVEFESCASGGARIDLEVLEHTDRVWASDTNDPLERQRLQRWTTQLLPPELIGSHVGPQIAHTSGRWSTLQFRCLTSLFGHAGLEMDVTELAAEDHEYLRSWTALYKELRGLLHTGNVVRADHPDPSVWVHGVVAADCSEAAYAVVRMDTSPEDRTDRVRLPGLDPAVRYRVEFVHALSDSGNGIELPPWIADGGVVELSGSMLARAGVALPVLFPQTGVLLRVQAV
ncbi:MULTISPECIES: alpha-galactosidase [unclassified Rhodococcus (in: high G+C Gram-positive bacteria)]|uniref:alpha-galactosidase n=1 Tax=unclassified Rhodococcus (in: high G+C Gram-positive bacteria) TaxID=192944 RepID=UPI00211B5C89|nr:MULTISPECIES: alpha-galactosidase [unclassified Rhodococcus (in: high G+C Gram-positive bacteria)]